MAMKESKKLLDKINSLFQQISAEERVSGIERDLLLGYVREFYESLLESANKQPNADSISEVTPEETITKISVQPAAKVQTAQKQETNQEVKPENKPENKQPVAPEPAPAPVVETVKEEIFIPKTAKDTLAAEPTAAQKETKTTESESSNDDFQAIIQSISKQAPLAAKTDQRPLIKPTGGRVDNNELFEEKSGRELSDKLGEMPIDDLKKGMSLNERIIFLNELFDGNINEFENALHSLNIAAGFEGAKKLLVILATRFDWSTKERQAKTFIKLVKRRHSS